MIARDLAGNGDVVLERGYFAVVCHSAEEINNKVSDEEH